MYGVYDLKNYEMCVGMFDTPQEVANFFNTSKVTILSYISKKQIRAKRYEIIKIDEVTNDL